MPRQRFAAGKGGTLVFYPPEGTIGGAPSAATVTCTRSSGAALPEPVTAAVATLDAVSTALATPAEAGSRLLVLEDAAGVRPGRRYLVRANDDGEIVPVHVVGVGASGTVRLRTPLTRDVPAGAEVRGWAVTYALSPANTPAPASGAGEIGYLFRAEWSYEIGGVPYPGADQLYEVRRRLLRPVVTAADVSARVPSAAGDVEITGDDVLEAWDDVLDGIAARGIDADRVMNPDRLRLPHLLRALATASDRWGPPWREWAESKRAEADAALETAVESADWYDADDDAVQDQGEQLVSFARIVR